MDSRSNYHRLISQLYHTNFMKISHIKSKIKKKFWGRAWPPSQTPPPMGMGTALPTPHPPDATSISISALTLDPSTLRHHCWLQTEAVVGLPENGHPSQ